MNDDFRLALALEVADQMKGIVQKERCPDCQHPLVMKPEQGMPFCWFCVTDRMAASRGRTSLTKAKLAAKGIFLEDLHPAPMFQPKPTADEERSSWIEGMPA